ncbi:MAG: hypothetical protein K2L84_01390 [Muribaculaceae bacterium]|nr:hypothetical protein [Muribaculaceae bacterium]
MRRIIYLIIIIISVAFNAIAVDYRPFIEEGKTWWHETVHNGIALSPTFRSYEGITMRGDTVIDDVVWKKCYTIDLHKKLGVKPLVLMREADNKVYSMALDRSASNMKDLNTEYLVYDFSLEADDTYYILEKYVDNPYDEGLVGVSETGVEVQNGNEFRYQMARLSLFGYPRKCIEGIGSVNMTYFYMPFYPERTGTFSGGAVLSYVTDKDNNIIYEVFEGRKSWEFAPPVAPKGYAYRPMGEEGKTWWYTSKKSDGDAEFGITVCGDTIVDGMTWKKLYFVNEKLEREQQPVAIIRDEDRRVYATCLAQSRDELPDYAPDYVELGKISNTCIYDFNLVEDETFTTVVGSGDAFVFRCRNAAYVENTYKWFRRNYLSYPGYASAFVYDGVGNTVGSCFFAPLIENKFEYEDNATLRWVTDAENEVVFTGAGGRKLWEGDYRSFVEEGKTWWHETVYYGSGLSPAFRTYEGITMRGDTVIDDVVWKKCYTIDLHKKLSAEPFLLMRESKKKVYSMALDNSAEWLHALNAYLIYDFTLEAGDSYELTDNPYYNGLVIVSETGEEVRDGDKFRYQLAGLSDQYPQKCVEGIGCVENTYFYMPFYPACACIPTSGTVLSYVTDKDNNIIYEVFDGRKTWEYAPPVAPKEYAYRPMGEEGKTWWYTSRKFDGDTEYGITVCGDTIVDGMTWKKIYFVNEKLEREAQPVAIIRDEDRRVYATCLAQSVDELPDYAPDYMELGVISNTCIYDFNLIEDETFTTVVGSGNAFVFKCRNAAYVENSDAWFRRNYLSYPGYASFLVYDGVGNTMASCFFAPLIDNNYAYNKNATLRWVTDAENEIVFTGAGGTKLWEQSGVDAVVAESGDEAVYYNLQGMPVADDRLVPGVYVKVLGGKVTKVMIR